MYFNDEKESRGGIFPEKKLCCNSITCTFLCKVVRDSISPLNLLLDKFKNFKLVAELKLGSVEFSRFSEKSTISRLLLKRKNEFDIFSLQSTLLMTTSLIFGSSVMNRLTLKILFASSAYDFSKEL